MSILADALRPFWLPGLNDVSGLQVKDISGWICDEEFQVYSPVLQESFSLSYDSPLPLVRAYAAEVNRISIAAFETLTNITPSIVFGKSTAWLVIKTYYAAFFAAHCLMRMVGVSCGPIGRFQTKSIDKIATIYGFNQQSPRSGLYEFRFDRPNRQLTAKYLKGMAGGPHETFWRLFHDQLDAFVPEILKSGTGTIEDQQAAVGKIGEILGNLSFGGAPKANWLSTVRNTVNYNHGLSTWFPYRERTKYYDQLFLCVREWRQDPMNIDLSSHEGRDLRRFQATCNCILGLCRELAEDMASRCSTGKSFQEFGCMAFLNILNQPRSAERA